MSRLSHGELTLLALLSEGPAHAYELVQRVRSMRVEQWARVPESTLYAVLRRMESRGWVTGVTEVGYRGSARTSYRRTVKGTKRLNDLIARGIRRPEPVYSDLLVSAIFASGLHQPDMLEAAVDRLEDQRARLTTAQALGDASEYARIILRFYSGLADLHAEALDSLRSLDSGSVQSDDPLPVLPTPGEQG